MKTGIIGLGLIGGSIAKAYKENGNTEVLGFDTDHSAMTYAKLSETIDGELCDSNISECDVVIIALYPGATIKFLEEKASLIKKNALVIDTCGTKREVCAAGFKIAEDNGFVFVGGHPMAGVQFSGIKYSRGDMFEGASMVVVPPSFDDIYLLERIKETLRPMQFGKYTVCTAEKHDQMIAYTSQLAHVVSNAYIKRNTAKDHHGFSAGSYRDMTRVATLNEEMWTELFLVNKDNLTEEISALIDALTQYRTALENSDEKALTQLLREGRMLKEAVDG